MKHLPYFNFLLVLLVSACSSIAVCKDQQTFGTQYLRLKKAISLPGVKGRIDHLAISSKDRIAYIAALGNNTLEVVDLKNGKVIHSISGLDEPQGVEYISGSNEIFLTNGGNGNCYFYDADSFEKTATIRLASDADDVRYDPTRGKIYVGYGNGGIALIDAKTKKQIGDIKLPAHPEGFQVADNPDKIFVNLPDTHKIAVIHENEGNKADFWPMKTAIANFPMAIDEAKKRLFVVSRIPARLMVIDAGTGRILSEQKCVGDADDVYYDEANHQVYITGGGGFINIFREQSNDSFKQIANIASRSGARTSLLVPDLQLFLVAERARGSEEARLLVYSIIDSKQAIDVH